MSGLNRIVVRLVEAGTPLGGTLSDETIKALGQHRKASGMLGLIVFGAVVVGVLVAIYMTLLYVRDPAGLKIAVGSLGFSLAGALAYLRSVWKEWSETNLLVILLADAREDEVANLLNRIINKV